MRVEAALISMSTQYHPGIARAIWIPWDHSKFMTDLRVVAAPIVGIVFWLIARLAQKAFRNLPPGPKGLPIVGDVLHITDQDWLASPQRKEEYGDTPHSNCINLLIFLSGEMMYVGALGRGVLVINSQRIAVDLLEKRSNIYSDRPNFISAGDFSTRHLDLPMAPYGDLCDSQHSVSLF